jgi:hypothetical protein
MAPRSPGRVGRSAVTAKQGDHEQKAQDYWTRPHGEAVVLDIGEDVGALVLYAPPELHGREIEVSPIGQDGQRVHTAVLARRIASQTIFAAVYPELRAGSYRIWSDDPSRIAEVTIAAGRVAEIDWR